MPFCRFCSSFAVYRFVCLPFFEKDGLFFASLDFLKNFNNLLKRSRQDEAMETFIRKELKYRIKEDAKAAFLKEAGEHLIPDTYFECDIYTIYLDTEHFDLMRLCEGKPDYKCKARLRAYKPVYSEEDAFFFELKKKIRGCPFKRRHPFTKASLQNFYDHPEHAGENSVTREIASFLNTWPVRPRFTLYAHRFCYVWKEDPTLRLTFDDQLFYRDVRPGLYRDPDDVPLLEKGWNIFEIKCSRPLPLELCRLLERPGIVPGSFSKAGAAYARQIQKTDCLPAV